MERNLRLYGPLQITARAYFWLPVGVLFFLDRFGLTGALRLAAIYYLAVVALEVPSGWFSDRTSRVTILRIGAAAWVLAHALFVLADRSFAAVAVAQILVGAGFACLSGTDVSFHFDSLEALDRDGEYEEREARAVRMGMGMTSVAALTGGLLGAVDFRLAFGAAFLAAGAQLAITLRLSEPPRLTTPPLGSSHAASWLRYLQLPLLAWLFGYMLAEVTLQHLDFELAQPYLAQVLGEGDPRMGGAPAYSGLLVATASAVGALSVASSVRMRLRFGLTTTLVLLAGLHVASIVAMAAVVSLVVVPLLTLRSVQIAAAPVLVSAATAPRIERHHRATFLSLASLAGRLGYGVTLLALSSITNFQLVLRASAGLAVTLIVALILTARLVDEEAGGSPTPARLLPVVDPRPRGGAPRAEQ